MTNNLSPLDHAQALVCRHLPVLWNPTDFPAEWIPILDVAAIGDGTGFVWVDVGGISTPIKTKRWCQFREGLA